MTDDDDLRFGDVDHEKVEEQSGGTELSGIAGSVQENFDLAPLLVALFVVAYIILTQPLSSTVGGISMNWLIAAFIAVAGIYVTLET